MQIFGLGTPEIILIVVVLLLFFGKDRLPDLARSVGKSVTELKRGFTEGWKEDEAKSGDAAAVKDDAVATKQAEKAKK